MNKTICIICITLMSALTPVAAQARTARTMANVNMRTAPDFSYPIVTVIPRGKIVKARYCISNGWCRVSWHGKQGWIKNHFLRVHHLRRKANNY